jgi:sucrose-6-phosphate hydrolase SacC (GH32 family)
LDNQKATHERRAKKVSFTTEMISAISLDSKLVKKVIKLSIVFQQQKVEIIKTRNTRKCLTQIIFSVTEKPLH